MSLARPVVHEIVGGWCRVCGDTEAFLRLTGAQMVKVEETE